MGSSTQVTIFSLCAGLLFGLGWWLWIDSVAYASHIDDPVPVSGAYWIPGIFGTVAVLLICITPTDADDDMIDENRGKRIKAFLLFSFFVGIASILASMWILIEVYGGVKKDATDPKSSWPGIAGMLQTLSLFVSALLYRWCKSQSSTDDL
ncbi:small membrane protein-related [Anaeramoeba flamelloides]|uniref:Small membrane protein-related n=1 Tax=Anaeramoeba flamelloides TaxID=1746091 RepID=A0AAV7Z620_9EUKA|nr:small membrane protein-related [Anaeramoeba flamelloides]KAJ6235335.1 small membrane protein-related [Anaeramoeba flamelloides]|eukprot:Anaeramoba_flamelloidesa1058232_106.p1 GENE.a1058232_106~~a1058232_106.p1  ORF type:complete len:166 (-),score=29.01 a1058232_106:189-641(-)